MLVEVAQRPELVGAHCVDARPAALDALDVEHGIAGVEFDLAPFEVGQFLTTKAVPVGEQNPGGVALAVAAGLAGGSDLDLRLVIKRSISAGGQVFALAGRHWSDGHRALSCFRYVAPDRA